MQTQTINRDTLLSPINLTLLVDLERSALELEDALIQAWGSQSESDLENTELYEDQCRLELAKLSYDLIKLRLEVQLSLTSKNGASS